MENVVNGVKTIMVKEPLRTAPAASHRRLGHARKRLGLTAPLPWIQTWPNRNR